MNNNEIIERIIEKIDRLKKEAAEIEIKVTYSPFLAIGVEKFVNDYERWYSEVMELIKEHLPERRTDFKKNYALKQGKGTMYDTFSLDEPNKIMVGSEKEGCIFIFDKPKFMSQEAILNSIPAVLEIRKLSLSKEISIKFYDDELKNAKNLLKYEHESMRRAAGAIAGVSLERVLKDMCDTYNIKYKEKDTINPLATELCKNKILNSTECKRIQYLADIRNKCTHSKEDVPETKDIKDMINKVEDIIKKFKRDGYVANKRGH